jgi:hypothetical protein
MLYCLIAPEEGGGKAGRRASAAMHRHPRKLQ